MQEKIILYCRKILKYYRFIVEVINSSFKEDLSKTLVVLLVFIILFLFSGNGLVTVLFGSMLAVLVFKWESRIFFGIALIFLISCPILLLANNEIRAENMAVYVYYLLVAGVFVQMIEYMRDQRENIRKTDKQFEANWAIPLVLLILMIGGFVYLKSTFNNKLVEQNEVINRIGGTAIREDDAELKKMKEQIQGLLDTLSSAAYNQN